MAAMILAAVPTHLGPVRLQIEGFWEHVEMVVGAMVLVYHSQILFNMRLDCAQKQGRPWFYAQSNLTLKQRSNKRHLNFFTVIEAFMGDLY